LEATTNVELTEKQLIHLIAASNAVLASRNLATLDSEEEAREVTTLIATLSSARDTLEHSLKELRWRYQRAAILADLMR
jgi:hypothetical protein